MASISGLVFNDLTLNGFTADDGRVQGARVVITNSGGTVVSDNLTPANGAYSTVGLPAGTYQVAFTAPTNFGGVPGTSLTQTVVLATGASDGGAIVGMYRLGEIRGYKFIDQNLNGLDDVAPADPIQGGVTFRLVGAGPDNNFNTAADNTNQTSITDPISGQFVFPSLVSGSYRLSEDAGPNFARTTANFSDFTVNASGQLFVPSATFGTLDASQVRVVTPALAVGNYRLGEIRGLVFEDKDFSGTTSDSGAPPVADVGLANVKVALVFAGVNLDGTRDTVFGNANDEIVNVPLTNSTGNFRASGLKAGNYRMRINSADNPVAVGQQINFANVDFSTESYKTAGFTDFSITASGQLFAANPSAPGTPAADAFQQVLPLPGAGSLSIGVFERATLIVSTFNDLNRDRVRNSDSVTIGGPQVADQSIANVGVTLGAAAPVPTLANGTVTFAGLGRTSQSVTIGLDAATSEFSFNGGNYTSTRTVSAGPFRSGETITINTGVFRFGEVLGFAFGDRGDDGQFVVSATQPRDLLLPNVQVDLFRNGVKQNVAPVLTDSNGRFAYLPTGNDSAGNSLPKLVNGDYELRLTDPSGRLYGEPRPAIDTAGIVSKNVAVIPFRVTSGKVWVSALTDKPDAALDVVQLAAKTGSTNAQVLLTPDAGTLPALAVPFGFGGMIRGRVVLDKDADGFEATDPGIDTFVVELYRRNPDQTFPTTPTATRVSSAGGLYEFTTLQRGVYSVRLKTSAGELVTKHYQPTTVQPDSLTVRLNDILISDSGRVATVHADRTVTVVDQPVTPNPAIAPNITTTTKGLGFGVQRFGAIYGFVFEDKNLNGLQDGGESGLPNVLVRLFSANGVTELARRTTTVGGSYDFEDLRAGNYVVTASYIDGAKNDNSLGIISSGVVQPNQIPGQAEFGQSTPNVLVRASYNEIDTPSVAIDPRANFEKSPGLITLDNVDSNNPRLAVGVRKLVEVTGTLRDNAGNVAIANKTVFLRRTSTALHSNNSGPNNANHIPDTLPSILQSTTDANGKYDFWVWPGDYEVSEVLTSDLEPINQSSNATGTIVTVPQRRFENVSVSIPQPVLNGPVAKVAWSSLQDLNGDGLDDLIVVNERSNNSVTDSQGNVQISFATKNPDGSVSFSAPTTYWLGKNARPQHVTTGAIYKATRGPNGQFLNDIVIALTGDTSNRSVSQVAEDGTTGRAFGAVLILKNLGGGDFKLVDPMTGAAPKIPVGKGVLKTDITISDARLQSSTQSLDWKSVFIPNLSPGQTSLEFRSIGGNGPLHVSLFEVNGQVAIATSNNTSYDTSIAGRPNITGHEDVSIAILNSSSVFTKSSIVNFSTPTVAAHVSSTSVFTDASTGNVILAASMSRRASVGIRTWTGSGFSTSNSSTIPFATPVHVVFADLNNDGNRNELVVAGGAGLISYTVTHNGGHSMLTQISSKGAMYVSVGDINGDKRNDLAASFGGDATFQYFINTGTAAQSSISGETLTFKPSVPILPASTTGRTLVRQVALGKLNENGFADLVATHVLGGVTVHPNSEIGYDEWSNGVTPRPGVSSPVPGPLNMEQKQFVVDQAKGEGIVRHLSPIKVGATIVNAITRDQNVRDFGHLKSGAPAAVATRAAAVSRISNRAEGEVSYDAMDVNRDGMVTPLDALVLINALNTRGSQAGSSVTATQSNADVLMDVNGDGDVTPLDVLLVINRLNANSASASLRTASVAVDQSVPPLDIKKQLSAFDETDSVFASSFDW